MKRFAMAALMVCLYAGPVCAVETAIPTEAPATAAPEPTLSRARQLYVDRIALFKQENAKLDPAKRYVVFLGDSLTQGAPLETLFPDTPTLNRGIGSDGITWFPARSFDRGVINRIKESVTDCQASTIFLLIGTNDVAHGEVEMDHWKSGYRELVALIRKEAPQAKLVIQTLPPSRPPYTKVELLNARVEQFNVFLKEFAAEEKLPLLDLNAIVKGDDGLLRAEFTGDGLHLKRDAYELWAVEVRKHLPE